jgi:hypothetical protein
MNAIPKAYAPRGLGPNQQRWMERKGWIDRRIIRTKSHHKDCRETCSAYVCSCQAIKEQPNAE